MGIPGSANPMLFGGAAAYQINQSLRFKAANSSRLTRTPGTSGNRRTWTLSMWVKKWGQGIDGKYMWAAGVWSSGNPNTGMFWTGPDKISTTNGVNGVNNDGGVTTSTAVYRDPSAWMHLVFRMDTANATLSNRHRVYVNGQLLETASSVTQNFEGAWNHTVNHALGGNNNHGTYSDVFLTEVYNIDGQSLGPESFGETDTITGAWIPKKYSGSYGTNGFYLKFDPSATNGIGHDHSGNGNNFTATGFTTTAPGNGFYIKNMSTVSGSGSFGGGFDGDLSTSASSENFSGEVMTWTPSGGYAYTSSVEVYGGEAAYDQVRINGGSYTAMPGSSWKTIASGSGTITTIDFRDSRGNAAATFSAIRVDGVILVDYIFNSNYDVLTDTPTNNWCTLNPLNQDSAFTLSDGNLRLTSTANTSSVGVTSTSAVYSGKWYWEITRNSWNINCGMSLITTSSPRSSAVTGSGGQGVSYLGTNIYKDGSSVQSGLSNMVDGDVAGIALNLDSNTVQFYRNGSALGTAVSISAGTWTPSFGMDTGGYAANVTTTFNFGQRAFAYTPPTGFKALNTANLPEPTIKKGSTYFNTVAYSGSSSNQAITVGFEPDFLWIKRRNGANDHNLYNAIVGLTGNYLVSNSTGAENSNNSRIVATSSTGFTVGTGSADTNGSGNTYVAWAWDANGAGSSNTAGSITSTVSANATAGFSIATYTGNGTSGATIGHGLGVAPSFIAVKARDAITGGGDWNNYHAALGATKRLFLNQTDAAQTTANSWNNTAPSSTVFSVGNGTDVNQSTKNYVAYCFSEVAGYSKFGSYTGNGSTDGVFVYCGFRPRWIMVKTSSNAYGWAIFDTARQTYNEDETVIQPNTSSAEATNSLWGVDILSNGFKWRNGGEVFNFSGYTYIFAAFAEHPFKYANAR